MEIQVLDQIPFSPSPEVVMEKMRVKPGSRYQDLVMEMTAYAASIGRPKALFRLAGIDSRDDQSLVVEGIQLESKILAVNLEGQHRVFPFLATGGRELYDWKMSLEDIWESYCADTIGQMALRSAEQELLNHIKTSFGLKRTAAMNPGSLEDWPISAQRELFQLLGDPMESIGVELLDSMLMIPNQTVSGLRFRSEDGYSNCELCPRGCCTHRRAPYDESLLKSKYS